MENVHFYRAFAPLGIIGEVMSDKEKILIADDSAMNRAILTEMLGDGYEILEAENGRQAVAILQSATDIDLLLLDIMMPEMDGFEVLAMMNKYHWIDEVPVIMISAENASSYVERAYDLGATDYISRPFDMAVVRRRVINTLMLYAKQKRLVRLVAEQVYEKEKSNSTMINILSHIVEFRNGESGMHVLHIQTATDILLHKDTILSEDIHRKIERITDRLSQQEPIQYILGYTDFCGRRFDIAPGALIPRPETEELTRLVITENSGQPLRIADLGTGSGCIAVTLALSLPGSKVEAWDISTEALEIAQCNARKHNAHVNFFQRDILRYDVSELPEESLDIIVSNPPYIRRCESRSMSANVLEYEPHIALFVPNESPLLFYEKIAKDSVRLLSPGGKLYFEINEAQGEACARMLEAAGYKHIRIIKDLYEKNRFVSAIKPIRHG